MRRRGCNGEAGSRLRDSAPSCRAVMMHPLVRPLCPPCPPPLVPSPPSLPTLPPHAPPASYIEACESGSIFEGLLEDKLGIYATTAANGRESSWGTYCPGM